MKTPTRVQLRRTKGWRMPPNTVKVARPTKWGNPFIVGRAYSDLFGPQKLCTAELAVAWYRAWILAEDGLGGEKVRRDLGELRGKSLACFCKIDRPCHADVLLELANSDEQ